MDTPRNRTVAVVVGISTYTQAGVNALQFADQDAQAFYDFLISKRGGANPGDVTLLLNQKASLDAIRSSIRRAFDVANSKATVVLFIAGHGISMDNGPNKGAYILTANSNPENLPATGLRMEELQELTTGPFMPRQVHVFVDACHSGVIGSIKSLKFNNRFETDIGNDKSPTVFGLMASRYKELSYECANYRHGAFTYYLLRGLNTGEAADGQSGRVTADSLIEFVRGHVRTATNRKQNPEARGAVGDRLQLADLRLPGSTPESSGLTGEVCVESRGRAIPIEALAENEDQSTDPFSEALRHGVILPGLKGSAFDLLEKQSATPEYKLNKQRLLISLENAGQQVILHYLRGNEVPQSRDQFRQGKQFFDAAARLEPNDSFVESRRLFCLGRQFIFDRKYVEAISTLERSIQLFPAGAYSNNAIGIAYLESSDFERAIDRFKQAIDLAPYWAYPRHNLALALTQVGQYSRAIAAYQAAASLSPHYSYIQYNLGLLFERLNRPEDARTAWRKALELSPNMARAWNAMGLSYFLEHHYDAANHAYQIAASLAVEQTDRLAIRHDTALLRVVQNRETDAIRLWQLNLLENPDDLPSLMGLSDAFVRKGEAQPALRTLRKIVQKKPNYAGGRFQYAKLLMKSGNLVEAAAQFQEIINLRTENPDAYELLADTRMALNRGSPNEVKALYERGFQLAITRTQRKRIRAKLRALESH